MATRCRVPHGPRGGRSPRWGAAADGSQPFAGRMLQVRVSTVARYVDDFDPAPVLESDGDTAALYRFDKETGETVPDLSGNNRTGRLRAGRSGRRRRACRSSVVTPAAAPKPAIAPFDAAEAERYQEEWAAYLKVPVEYTNSLGIKFRLIPPGEFQMGSTSDEIADGPAGASGGRCPLDWSRQGGGPSASGDLTRPFYLAATEVTQSAVQKGHRFQSVAFLGRGKGQTGRRGVGHQQSPGRVDDVGCGSRIL